MGTISDYEKYQLEWLIAHGYSITDLIRELDSYIRNNYTSRELNNTTLVNLFDEWETDVGFCGEIFVCENEFQDWGG